MTVPTYVVIPYLGKMEMTGNLVKQIIHEGWATEVLLYNNGPQMTWRPWDTWHEERSLSKVVIRTINATGWNLHRMFNDGINRAMSLEIRKHNINDFGAWPAVNVALMNNDLILEVDNYVEQLSTALRADPTLAMVGGTPYEIDPGVHGDIMWTNNENGHRGESVMLRGELPFRFDERFEWWRGDDDMVAQIQNAGYWVGLVTEARHTHIDGGGVSAALMVPEEFAAKIARDTVRFHNKWPQIPDDKLCLPVEYLMPRGTDADRLPQLRK